tara:strand:+ start:827 stop:1243 length:417 start_codon:yes stop_codon:yes gene_type:complete
MPSNTSAPVNNSQQRNTQESNVVISTPSLKELPVVSTMDGATQRYKELHHIVTQYLDGGPSELMSDVKQALYELQDYHQTQLDAVNELIASVHNEQAKHYAYRSESVREDDTDEFGGEMCWYYNDDGEMEFEHSSEGC